MSSSFGVTTETEPTVELRNQLVEHYLPLVKYNAERIWARLPDGVDLDDLISAGVFGLMDAIDAFDLERGVKFETYCVPRIRGAMLDELRTMDWVPRLVRSKHTKLEEARKSLEADARPAAAARRNGRQAGRVARGVRQDAPATPPPSAWSVSTRNGTRPTATRTSARSTSSKTRRPRIRRTACRTAT